MSVLPHSIHTVKTAAEPHRMLEECLASWSNSAYVVSCSSGTAALHLALESLTLPQGTSVVVPNYTMVACARAVELAGLVPVFCEVTDRMVMDLDHLDYLCSHDDSIMGVMPVHLYGRTVNMDELDVLRRKYGIYVVEDLAEAHGINPHWCADASCWSFYKNKIVAGDEGGAVAFREGKVASKARSLRSLGFTEAHDYTHIPRGHNYRMSNTHASLIMESLVKVGENLTERRAIEATYDKLIPYQWHNVKAGPREVVWVYDIRVPNMTSETQNLLINNLRQGGIQARHGFKPMTRQEEFKRLGRKQRKRQNRDMTRKLTSDSKTGAELWYNGGISNSDRLSREVIYLPVQPGVTTPRDVFRASELIHHTLTRV